MMNGAPTTPSKPHHQLLKKNLNNFNAQNNADIADAEPEKSKSTRSGFEVGSPGLVTPLKLTFQTKKKKMHSIRKKKRKNKCRKILKFIDKFFMLLCLGIIIPLSYKYPIGHNDGPLYPEITSSWVVTITLFFILGLGIKLEYLKRSFLFWEMNVFAHFIIFVYYPLIGFSIYLIANEFPESVVSNQMMILIEGIVILCTLPATAASAVVFTTNSYGNEAAAAINCTLSNLLGIFITPALILLFKHITKTTVNVGEVFYKLGLRVIAPFILGQIIRSSIGDKGREIMKTVLRPYIKKLNEICLLYMIFCALSESFYIGIDLTAEEVVSFVILIEFVHIQGYFTIWYMHLMFMCCMGVIKNDETKLKRSVYDRVACIYAGVSKTIALGIPLIETIYGGTTNVGLYILPILIYHPSNLIWGQITVEPFKKEVLRERCTLSSYSGTALTEATGFTQQTLATDYAALTPYPFDPHDSFRFMPFTAQQDDSDEDATDGDQHKRPRSTRPLPRPQYY